MIKPNCVIIGAAKAGTTSLYRYLLSHPEVYLPREMKEIGYFSGANETVITEEDYLKLYEGSDNYPVRMDISTSYLYESQTPAKINDLLGGDTKIIVLLRNPINAAYSLWKQIRHFGTEPLSFEEALAVENQRINDTVVRKYLSGWAANYFYTDRYIYTPQLRRYLEYFPKEKIAIYIFEEFFDNLEKSWQDFCSFLDIDPSHKPVGFGVVHNPSGHGIRSSLLQKALNKNIWWKKAFVWAIPKGWKTPLRLTLDDLNKVKNTSDKKIDQTIKMHLQQLFSEDVRELEKLLHRPLNDVWF